MRVSSCNFQHKLMRAGLAPGLKLRSYKKVGKEDLLGLLKVTAGVKD